MIKRCSRCRYAGRKAIWICRGCGAQCCEHLCSLKIENTKTSERTAACGQCKK